MIWWDQPGRTECPPGKVFPLLMVVVLLLEGFSACLGSDDGWDLCGTPLLTVHSVGSTP